MDSLRSALFVVFNTFLAILFSSLSVLSAPFLSPHYRQRLASGWVLATRWLLRTVCGIRIEVEGAHHLRSTAPMVVAANHQSQWETFFLFHLVHPQTTVLKRELLRIPFFGWALRVQKPIAIDRGRASQAIRQLMRAGSEALKQGRHVVIYPEGHRQLAGQLGEFNAGAASLAIRNNAALLPVAHNSGDCWPAGAWRKRRGVIRFVVGAPISSAGKSVRELNEELMDWMHEHYPRIQSPFSDHTSRFET